MLGIPGIPREFWLFSCFFSQVFSRESRLFSREFGTGSSGDCTGNSGREPPGGTQKTLPGKGEMRENVGNLEEKLGFLGEIWGFWEEFGILGKNSCMERVGNGKIWEFWRGSLGILGGIPALSWRGEKFKNFGKM